MKRLVPLLIAALAAPAIAAPKQTSPIAVAIDDPARPEADRARDADRHPAQLLAYAAIEPGQKVGDFIMGGGYLTRILAKAVGPKGKVYAYQPAEFIQYKASYGTDQDNVAKAYPNVVASRQSLAAFTYPELLDTIVTVQNWHDLHLKQASPELGGQIAAKLFATLKPGGILLVVDHVGLIGATPFEAADTLHRGDPAATKREIEAAGFRLESQSPLYANPKDPHTAAVFDPAIRGKTDQFVFRFRKPV